MSIAPRVPAFARQPRELVERTRWLFWMCAMFALAVTYTGAAVQASSLELAMLTASAGAFVFSWQHRYRFRKAPPILDALDVAAIIVFTLACPVPSLAFGVLFSGLWFRAIYGSLAQALYYTVGQGLAVLLAVGIWDVVPGHFPTSEAPLLGQLPILLVNLVVGRHLATMMFARDQARQRDAARTALGVGLLSASSTEEVVDLAWAATEQICRATPGLRVLVVTERPGDDLVVQRFTTAITEPPTSLPRALVEGIPATGGSVPRVGALDDLAGPDVRWWCLPIPGHGSLALLGAPPRTLPDALDAIRSVHSQVTLALRNVDSRRDLEVRAHTDALTGLANRPAFTAGLRAILDARTEGSWVLFVDLDDFKVVNDTHGHATGDELLQATAHRLSEAVRDGDLVARFGGDEFAVLLRSSTEATARAVAERIVQLTAAPVRLAGRTVRVGASVGLVAVAGYATPGEVLRGADAAMYAAKLQGKNCVRVFAGSHVDASGAVAS